MLKSGLTTKVFDTSNYGNPTSVAGLNFPLSRIPQGNTDSDRSGDSIRLLTLEIRAEAFLQGIGGTNDFTNLVRLVCYQWKPVSTASAPIAASVLNVAGNQTGVMEGYSWDSKPQFDILMDRTVSLSGNGPSDVFIDFKHKFKGGKLATWAAGSTSIQANGIFIIAISDSLLATHPITNIYSRITYIDS